MTAGQVVEAVALTGMRAEPWADDGAAPAAEGYWERNRHTILTASGGFLAAAVACYAASILAGVWTVLPKAWVAAKRLAPDMNLLMVVAVCGAVGIGEWVEAATGASLLVVFNGLRLLRLG